MRRKSRGIKKPKTTIRKMIKSAINRNLETKQSVWSSSDGTQIFHNNYIVLDSDLLLTTQGVTDPTNAQHSNRIGDEVMLKGIQLKMMIELNERYSDVTFRLIVVKSAKGDTPTRSTLFNALSGNKMLDTLNTERYTILKSKTFKITARNYGNDGVGATAIEGQMGFNEISASQSTQSRATRIINMYLPGRLFGRGGKIKYENNTDQQKFFDYHVMMFAYSNLTGGQDFAYVGRVNDYIRIMKFKDG